MDLPATGALKRKLDALGYTNADNTCDTVLVRQMVDDLIHTTDCYLALKQQSSAGMQHVNHLTDKVILSGMHLYHSQYRLRAQYLKRLLQCAASIRLQNICALWAQLLISEL